MSPSPNTEFPRESRSTEIRQADEHPLEVDDGLLASVGPDALEHPLDGFLVGTVGGLVDRRRIQVEGGEHDVEQLVTERPQRVLLVVERIGVEVDMRDVVIDEAR